MSSLILVLLLVQSLFTGASGNDDDAYFQKAIFRKLKEKKAQFSSEMEMTEYSYGHRYSLISTADQEERFSFKTNNGFYSFYSSFEHFYTSPQHTLYLNESKELYSFSESKPYCRSREIGSWEVNHHLR